MEIKQIFVKKILNKLNKLNNEKKIGIGSLFVLAILLGAPLNIPHEQNWLHMSLLRLLITNNHN